jgi:CDP-paratose 2-epimerase
MKSNLNRSALIFGGAGFIGSNLAYQLLTQTEARVHIFDNLTRPGVRHNLEWLRKAARNSGRLQVTVEDVRDRKAVSQAVAKATEIYHFAAQVAVTTSVADPREDFEVNLCGTFNVLEAARVCGHKPFMLFTSTNKVYGNLGLGGPAELATRYAYPAHHGVSELQSLDFHSPYGCSKGAADQYVHDYARIYGLPTVVFRMSCIAGPRQFGTEDQGWVAHFMYSALQQKPIVIYGDGKQVRDVLCVYDLVRAFEAVRLNAAATAGQVYNVGGGSENSISLLELIREIKQSTGRQLEYVLDERRPGDQLFYITDYRKLQTHTGWEPEIELKQTLRLLRTFWEENQEIFVQLAPVPQQLEISPQLSGRAA